ncbi:MAG: Smr/MutS family protein [Deltaproteobacteria bacterium]|nr:Smr/MutS family protein [Deltaproteobacteria bacterium]
MHARPASTLKGEVGVAVAKRKEQPFNNPFTALGEQLQKDLKKARKEAKKAQVAAWTTPKPKAPEPEPEPEHAPGSDADLFAAAVRGIDRTHDPRGKVRPPLPPANADAVPVYDEDAEALAELASLVDGTGRFDISDSDEFIEGCMEGLDRRILQKLKRGDFAFQSHLDLHGMMREDARSAVDKFIADQRVAGRRCVLIVHGRGHNSKDQIPVLKGLLKNWLERGRIAKSVLAFCTARPHDGGAGAMYVLLRR